MWKKHKMRKFMMRKTIGLLLAVTMAYVLVICSGEKATETKKN